MNIAWHGTNRFGRNFFLGALAAILMVPGWVYAASAPKISAAPAKVNFPPFRVGDIMLKQVVVQNKGTLNLELGPITFDGTDYVLFGQTNDCSSSLAPGAGCTVTVAFSPAAPYGKKSATMSIASNDPKRQTTPLKVKLSGQAPPPKISASPMSVRLTTAARTVTIHNTGISDLNISSVKIIGANASDFSMTDGWQPVLAQGASTSVDVSFTPGSPGTKSAILEIRSDDPKKSPVNVKLSGKPSTTYSSADMAGTWNGSILASGAGMQQWGRMTFTSGADGTFTGTFTRSTGSEPVSGKFSITSDGKITEPKNPDMLCTMDAGKTVVVCTDTPDAGLAQLGVFTKKGNSFEQTDLEGVWKGNALAAGPGSNWWVQTDIILAAGGAYTGNYQDSDGNHGPLSGVFNVTTDGAITDLANHPDMLCTIDTGKTVVACTDAPIPGAALLQVLTRQGGAITLADLAGTWYGNGLATGPVAPWWQRAVFTVKPDGAFTVKKTFSDGSTKSGSGTLELTPDGFVKMTEDNAVICKVDANRTVVVCTKTWNRGDQTDGSTELRILTRTLK